MGTARRWLAIATIAIWSIAASGPPALAQDGAPGIKRSLAIASTPKGGLTDDDRQIAAEWLADHARDFRRAPSALVGALEESHVWTVLHARYAQALPRRLERLLSPPAEGTVRLVFDGALVVVKGDTNTVIEVVPPER
jgi:hypothetical protein